MAVLEINRDPSPKTLLSFGALLALFCGLVGALLYWRFDLPQAARIVWIAGLGLAVLYYAVPPLRRPIYLGWIYAAFPIGWLLSHLLLAVIYYLVLTPIALVMRLLVGRDALHRRFDSDAGSYWVEYRSSRDPKRYFRQF